MKPLKPCVAAVVMAVVLLVQTGLSWAQRSDVEERLRRLEEELGTIRQERAEDKKQRLEPPRQEGAKFPIQFGASVTVRYDITEIEDKTELRVDDTQSGF